MKRLPAAIVHRIAPIIEGLCEQPRPRGCLKLEGEEATYRIRIGDYRIVYEISDADRVVLITRVRHRREAYD